MTRPIGYVFTHINTMQPPTGQRYVTQTQASEARDQWEARYGLTGEFVVCALVPVEHVMEVPQ